MWMLDKKQAVVDLTGLPVRNELSLQVPRRPVGHTPEVLIFTDSLPRRWSQGWHRAGRHFS
jgi:hypothetical protein